MAFVSSKDLYLLVRSVRKFLQKHNISIYKRFLQIDKYCKTASLLKGEFRWKKK